MIVPARFDDPRVRGLLDALAAHYVTVYGAHDLDDDDPSDYAPPDGGCLVDYQDGVPVALACWRRHDRATCELRRFYVAPAARGRGLARGMLAAALERARDAGYTRAVCATVAGGGLAGLNVRQLAPFGPHTELAGVRCYEVSLHGRDRGAMGPSALVKITALKQSGRIDVVSPKPHPPSAYWR